MKSSLAMEGKSAVEVNNMQSVQQPEIRFGRSSKRKVLILGAVIGVAFILVVAGVSVGTFYLGMKASQEIAKEHQDAWINFKTADNDTIIKQLVIVKATEVDIRRPGVIRKVIDYEKNRLVYQYDEQMRSGDEVRCYVYDFEHGMFGSREDAEYVVTSGVDTHVVQSGGIIVYKTTGVEVPIGELSPAARDLCYGGIILEVKKVDQQEVERIRRGCDLKERCSRSCFLFFCAKKCTKEDRCTF